MTVRPIQIYLRPAQDQALRALAARRGTSIAEVIRCSVDRYLLALPAEEDPALRLVDLGGSGRSDLAARHDEVLAKAGRR
jgi:hypothetical protein